MFQEGISLDQISNRVFVNVIVDDKEVCDILYNKNTEERIDMIKRSIKIGVMALKNATMTVDTSYVQKEVERLIVEIDENLKKNLGKEGMKGELEKTFGENGYLENRLKEIFKEHNKTIADIFREDNINSPLYKIKRFMEENSRKTGDYIYDMLDPGNKDSLLSRLKDEITKKIDEIKKTTDIEMINKSIENIKSDNRTNSETIKRDIQGFKDDYNNKFIDIKKSLHEEVGDVKNMVTDANIELAKLAKEKQIVDITTLKGMQFEDVLFEFLSTKALTKYGDTIEVVNLGGGDRSGDIIINIKGSQDNIIVKAESTSRENVQMPDTIFKSLNNTMKERNTEYGIKVYENELPEKIGPILVGDNKIICSYLRGYAFEGYPLEVAYDVLRSAILRKNLEVDSQNVKLHVENIVRLMGYIQHITGNLTKMENLCMNTKGRVEEFRKNISDELDQILIKSTRKDKRKIKEDTKEEKIDKKSITRKRKEK